MPLIRSVIGAAGSGSAPTPPAGIIVGADPEVETLSFDVQAYATSQGLGTIPTEGATTRDPLTFGATGDGVADDTAEVKAAIAAMSNGETLDLSNGVFAVFDNSDDVLKFGGLDNITIKGGGLGTGLKAHPNQSNTGNRFDAIIRLNGTSNNVVIKDLEVDCNDQPIGAITLDDADNTWIFNCYCHNAGDGTNTPLALIKGSTGHSNTKIIANRLEDTSGDSGGSGARGYWSSGTFGNHVAHNIVRRTAHTGLIVHQDDDTPSIIRMNTIQDTALETGAAGIKAEMADTLSDSFVPSGIIHTFERNYVRQLAAGSGPWAIQPEGVGILFIENLCEGRQRTFASFDQNGWRENIIRDNIFENADEYHIHMDPDKGDATGIRIEFNTFRNPTKSNVQIGINFHAGYNDSAAFSRDKPITVTNNLITEANTNVGTQPLLNSYSNFTNIGNGPSGAGARNDLIPNSGQAPPPPTGWTPDDHATLLTWWNAGLGVATTGSDVDSWTDQEAGLIGTPPATSPLFVSGSINGKPGIDFNAASRLIVPQATAINNVWAKGSLVYMWMVIKITGASQNSRIIDKGFDGDQNGYRLRHSNSSTFQFEHRASTDGLAVETVNTFGNGDYALELSWDKGATTPTLRVNGTIESWVTNDTGTGLDDDSATDFTIGGQTVNATGQMDGHVLDLWFAQDPAAQELTDARAYITSEYGLTA